VHGAIFGLDSMNNHFTQWTALTQIMFRHLHSYWYSFIYSQPGEWKVCYICYKSRTSCFPIPYLQLKYP